MRVRPAGLVAVALVLGATLVNNSIPGLGALSMAERRINLRLPPLPGQGAARAGREGDSDVWAVARPAGEDRPEGPASGAARRLDGMEILSLVLTVGRRGPLEVVTNARTVGQLLGALGVGVGPADLVRPVGASTLWPWMHLRVIRVRTAFRTEVVELPFETLIRHSKELDLGAVRVLEEGRAGRAERTYRVTLRNGVEVRRVLVAERVLALPDRRVVLRGIGPVEPPEWVLGSHRQVGQASWYDFCPVDGYYAAHLTIPKGTAVTVRNLDNGRTVTVVINDRGPYGVPGRIIDLCAPAFAAIAPLGQGVANVELTW